MVSPRRRCTSLPASRTSLSGVFQKASAVKFISFQLPYNQESIRHLFIVAYRPFLFPAKKVFGEEKYQSLTSRIKNMII